MGARSGLVSGVRGAQQGAELAVGVLAAAVGPAVQGADDVAAAVAFAVAAQVAAALEHHGLAVAADVGEQLDPALRVAHQRAAFALLGQGVVVAGVGYGQLVPHVTGPALKDGGEFALEQRVVKVA